MLSQPVSVPSRKWLKNPSDSLCSEPPERSPPTAFSAGFPTETKGYQWQGQCRIWMGFHGCQQLGQRYLSQPSVTAACTCSLPGELYDQHPKSWTKEGTVNLNRLWTVGIYLESPDTKHPWNDLVSYRLQLFMALWLKTTCTKIPFL